MADSTIRVRFLGDASGAVRASSQVTDSMKGIGRVAKVAFATVGLAAAVGIGKAINAAAAFEETLNVLQAQSGATNKEMKQISELAKQLGADLTLPATSAKDAAEAMLELSKGGLTLKDTMDAARGSLELSAAANISNADAASIVARQLNAFGLAGKEAITVVDTLANAANFSTGEITDFALGLQQSSAVAKMYGLTLQQTTGALALFANKGIVGSDAGTLLKRTLQTLDPQSKKSADLMKELGLHTVEYSDGTLNLNKTIDLFTQQLGKLDPKQRRTTINQLAGSDAARGWFILLSHGSKTFQHYVDVMSKSGTAHKLAEARTKGFHGALEGLKSTLETVGINLGEKLIPKLTDYIRKLSSAIGWVDKFIASHDKLGMAADAWHNFGQAVQEGLSDILGMSDSDVASKAGENIVSGMGTQLETSVRTATGSWNNIGAEIGRGIITGIQKAIQTTANLAKSLADLVTRAIREVNWVSVGRELGPALAAMITTAFVTLTDPAFWIRNWDLALAVALTAFSGPVGRLAGRIGVALLRPFARALPAIGKFLAVELPDMILRAIDSIAPKLGDGFLTLVVGIGRAFKKLGPIILKAIDDAFVAVYVKLSDLVKKVGPLLRFVFRILGIQAAINAVLDFGAAAGQWIGGKATAAFDKARAAAHKVWEVIKDVVDVIKKIPDIVFKLPGSGLVKQILEAIKVAIQWLRDHATIEFKFKFPGDSVRNFFTNTLPGVVKKGKDFANDALDKIGEHMPSKLEAAGKAATSALNRSIVTSDAKAKLQALGKTKIEPKVHIDTSDTARARRAIIDALNNIRVAVSLTQNVTQKVTVVRGGKPTKYAVGGVVPGAGYGDTVPAMLTPGEVVLNAAQQKKLAKRLGIPDSPHAIFSAVQHFARGGVAKRPGEGRPAVGRIGSAPLKGPRPKTPKRHDSLHTRDPELAAAIGAVNSAFESINNIGQDIQNLGREYDILENEANLTEEEFIYTDEDGFDHLDAEAVKRRLAELDKLIAKRQQIIQTIDKLIRAYETALRRVENAVEEYNRVITLRIREAEEHEASVRDLTATLRGLKGPQYAEQRERTQTLLDWHENRAKELRKEAHELRLERNELKKKTPDLQQGKKDAGYDKQDEAINLKSLKMERDDIASIQAPISEGFGDGGGDGGGGDSGGGGGEPDRSAEEQRLREIIGRLALALGIQTAQLGVVNVFKGQQAAGAFARGGVVGFGGPAGKPQLALVHGGEMILNAAQQYRLGGPAAVAKAARVPGYARGGMIGTMGPGGQVTVQPQPLLVRISHTYAPGMEWLRQFVDTRVAAQQLAVARGAEILRKEGRY